MSSDAETLLQSLRSSSSSPGGYMIYVVSDDCKLVTSDTVVGTHRSAFVLYSQGSAFLNI